MTERVSNRRNAIGLTASDVIKQPFRYGMSSAASKQLGLAARWMATTHQMSVVHTITMSDAAKGTLRSPAKISMNSRFATS